VAGMGGLDSRYWRVRTQRLGGRRAMGSKVMWTGRSWVEGRIRGIKESAVCSACGKAKS